MYTARVVSHQTSDSPSVLFQCEFEGRRYLFGRIGEGMQRSMISQGHKMARIGRIFLTGTNDWSTYMSGLGGMLLTLADQGTTKLDVFGDRNAAWGIASLRHAVSRAQFDLQIRYAVEDIVDDVLTVVPVELGDDGTLAAGTPGFDQMNRSNEQVRGAMTRMFPNIQPSPEFDEIAYATARFSPDVQIKPPDMRADRPSMSYIIQPRDFRGKFDNNKADQLGIPHDRSRAKLVLGEPYVFPDGRVVTREMILTEDIKSHRIIFLDIPTVRHFEDTKNVNWFAQTPTEEQFNQGVRSNPRSFESNEGDSKPVVGIIIHHLGQQVDPFSPEYIEFMKQFGPDCEHLLSHPDYVPDSLTFKKIAQLNVALRLIAPKNFKELYTAPAAKAIPTEYIPHNVDDTVPVQPAELKVVPCVTEIAYRIRGALLESTSARVAENALTRHQALADIQTELLADLLERAPSLSNKIAKAHKNHVMYEARRKHKLRRYGLTDAAASDFSVSSAEDDDDGESFESKVDITENDRSEYDHVSVVTVGTGSASPAVMRNVIGTIVRLPFYAAERPHAPKTRVSTMAKLQSSYKTNEIRSILLDCGESTYHNLARMYGPGPSGVEFRLKHVKMVFISHMHADHHLGLVSFIHARTEAFNKARMQSLLNPNIYEPKDDRKLFVICPPQAQSWLEEWSDLIPGLLDDVEFIDARFFLAQDENMLRYNTQYVGTLNRLNKQLDIAGIQTVRAVHCPNAYSIAVTFNNGFKLSYSGDTRPNSEFVNIGRNSTLLVHEATMDDNLATEAFKKRHTTMTEALAVAQHMNARNVLLTHFSQRYPVSPKTGTRTASDRLWGLRRMPTDNSSRFLKSTPAGFDSDQAEQWNRNLRLAMGYDGMTMKLKDMNVQTSWTEVLNVVYGTLFAEDADDVDDDEPKTWVEQQKQDNKANVKRQMIDNKMNAKTGKTAKRQKSDKKPGGKIET
ncbi:hypothetical protein V1512DRAFT_290757 [Lipomyces arxii]|uniref:uncharacterized protein n=1 Tax=Lipomyces arxii TaxID=56418 RepID=UPI0034CDE40E